MSINPLIGRSQEWEHSEDQVDILSEINITPLTDIFLVLLIKEAQAWGMVSGIVDQAVPHFATQRSL